MNGPGCAGLDVLSTYGSVSFLPIHASFGISAETLGQLAKMLQRNRCSRWHQANCPEQIYFVPKTVVPENLKEYWLRPAASSPAQIGQSERDKEEPGGVVRPSGARPKEGTAKPHDDQDRNMPPMPKNAVLCEDLERRRPPAAKPERTPGPEPAKTREPEPTPSERDSWW